jgi:hypothetical protein
MIRLVTVASVLADARGVQPPATIDTKDDSETDYWAYRLNVSREELFAAIEQVGPSTAAIRRHLGK